VSQAISFAAAQIKVEDTSSSYNFDLMFLTFCRLIVHCSNILLISTIRQGTLEYSFNFSNIEMLLLLSLLTCKHSSSLFH